MPRTTPTELNELQGMQFDFLSLVPAGDNPRANVVLLKSRNPDDDGDDANVGDMSGKPNPSTVESPPAGGEAAPDSAELLKAVLAQNELLKDQNAALAEQMEAITKALADDPEDGDDDYDPDEDGDDGDDAGGDDPDGDDEADVAKARQAIDDLVKNHPAVKAMQAEQVRLAKELEEAQRVAKAAEDARVDEILKGRAAELEALGKPEEIAGSLRKAFDAMDLDAYQEFEGLLAKAARIAKEGAVFTEAGSSAKGADSKIDQLIAKSSAPGDTNDGLTPAQRLRKQLQEDPSLYEGLADDPSNIIGRAS